VTSVVSDHLEASPASLVAVATHARTGVARVALGSEAARMMYGSPIPVLVHPAVHGVEG
jgi:nucleotide-binding universal stress UspA family protein